MSHRLTLCALGLLLTACPTDSTGVGNDGTSTGDPTTAPSTTDIPSSTMTMTGSSMSASGATDSSGTETTGTSTDTDSGTTMTTEEPTTSSSSSSSSSTGDPTGEMTTTGDVTTTGDMTTTGETTTGDVTTTGDMTTTGGTTTTGEASTTTGESTTTGDEECVQSFCGNQIYECGDCEDNDTDGPIDDQDVECISPCDDDESSFATGIPGDNIDLCHQDCFFDGNSGAGDDGCEWFLACDPLDPDNGECELSMGQSCPLAQPQQCIDNCDVPNGCDCFGCCVVTVDGEDVSILVGAEGCSLENFDACPECTLVADCTNECNPDDCELCFGETELPPECEEPTCPDGKTSCLMDTDCADGFYCQTGCCIEIPT